MTFELYWKTVVKRWKLVVICFVMVGLGTFIVSKLTTPLYQSNSLVQVVLTSGSNPADYTSLLASDQLVQTEAQLATSDPVLREVASHYPGLSAANLSSQVTATTQLNTQLFSITVLDANPQRAAALANDIAQTLIQQQSQLAQQDNARSQQQLRQDLTSTNQQINTMISKIAVAKSSGNQTQVVSLQNQLGYLQQHYNQVQTTLSQLELTQAQSNSFLRIVQYAQSALAPAQPNVRLNTLGGFVAGLLLGLLLAMLADQLDMRVRTAEELAQLLNWSILGTVWGAKSSNRVDVVNVQGQDINVEAYRILRTNVGFAEVDKPLSSLVVTSAIPGEGKSTVAANLAIFMAKAGKNTLLVDADLRRPTQHQIFNLAPDRLGLSNAILASATSLSTPSSYTRNIAPSLSMPVSGMPAHPTFSLAPFIHTVGIPNLQIISSGPLPPNASELLDSKAMQHLLAAMTTTGVEMVIFDSPPLLGLSDSSILASKVDGVLVVVDITRASKAKLKQMKTVLSQTKAHVLGCVVNKQRRSRHDSSYSYYYYSRDEQQNEGKRDPGANVAVTPPHNFNGSRNPVELAMHTSRMDGNRNNG